MNPLRQNLYHALLSIALLVTMVSASHPDNGTAATAQLLRATHAAASAVCSFHGPHRANGCPLGVTPADAVRRAVEKLLDSSVR